MKKRIMAMLLMAVLFVSTAAIAFAAGGVETPMVPIESLEPIKDFATVRFSSNADEFVSNGDKVVFTTNIVGISSDGLSKAIFGYEYTDGLEFNNDIKVIGMPDGWTVSETTVNNNSLSFTISDTTGSASILNRALDFSFSFTVTGLSGSQQSVDMPIVALYDSFGEYKDMISKKVNNNVFTTEAAIPNISNIGASLRINNVPALRLGMLVEKDDNYKKFFPSSNFVYSEDADMKFGMLVIEESKLRGTLDINNTAATKTIFENVFSANANEVVFVHTIDNVTDYKKNYVFRPFVMYRESADGEYLYSYGDVKTRSAKKVAEMELESEISTKKIELLRNFIK